MGLAMLEFWSSLAQGTIVEYEVVGVLDPTQRQLCAWPEDSVIICINLGCDVDRLRDSFSVVLPAIQVRKAIHSYDSARVAPISF